MTDRAAVRQLIRMDERGQQGCNNGTKFAGRRDGENYGERRRFAQIVEKGMVNDDEKGSRPPWPEEKLISRIVPIYSKTVQVKGLICVGFIT